MIACKDIVSALLIRGLHIVCLCLLALGFHPILLLSQEVVPVPAEAPPTPTPVPQKVADDDPKEAAAPPDAAGGPEAAPTQPPLSRRELLESLSDEEVQKAIEAIKKSFLDPGVVSDAALRRAALEGLAVRFEPGIEIQPRQPATPRAPAHAFVAEILDSHIGYVRPGTIDAASLAQFNATLETFRTGGADALILDLRSTGEKGDFEAAAEFARRLCRKGQMLFTLQKPSAKQERIFTANRDPAFEGLVVVLTDSRTAGPAEALAATLRANLGAMVIGADTMGAAVEFESLPLGGGASLQLAVSQVLLSGSSPLFPEGVKPDIAIALPREVQDKIFLESAEKGVSPHVFELERSRMSEAALVANTNPEIDNAQASQRDPGSARPPRDIVLQRAVDLVTAIQFYTRRPER